VSDLYLLVKAVHILSATVLFGTGLGTAFFMWQADRSGDLAAIAVITRHVVLADWLFTTPAAIVQPATGLWLAVEAGYPISEGWMAIALALYLLAGACWLPVVWLQIRLRDVAAAASSRGTALPPVYRRYMRLWVGLGWPAFTAMLAIFYLMVFKPAL
jgi:uncharacterized membrane protein